ncbi:hypothetical protein TCAL_13330 [Tigriopus californicus]|uniref:J domain-containing protein n=1 Tax=Tigriopus californicus TaxID=6832 RepID=A0A553NSV6_TIGCA|nr:mitochondrial import inner membrane translocase subunit TIM14-like [Tigriopus californicus]TRY68493.1 hypothetical protein TCAL_13330 [Tigriopus californicus]|eukprot:TCALIF_13330-PA protein Name:"Similar to Tim14 Mitochondrial import inner membrane translocase subunit TIM14 (Drosophila melanogaster)" AED:0.06 eAED:0.06 QI:0/-1/0/1/-1/1/1/0/115
MSSMIMAGLGLAAVGFAGRYAARQLPNAAKSMEEAIKSMPKLDAATWANAKYYKGGFEAKMSQREAALILGVSPSAPTKKIRECHKRIMLLNHPDKGGSPYLAAKINEAKDLMDK